MRLLRRMLGGVETVVNLQSRPSKSVTSIPGSPTTWRHAAMKQNMARVWILGVLPHYQLDDLHALGYGV